MQPVISSAEKRKARWTRISEELYRFETLVDAAASNPMHIDHELCAPAQEHVNRAMSMADMAVDVDLDRYVDPPPRGASTAAWREALMHLRDRGGCENADIRAGIRRVSAAYRGD